jgi:hypothetical protein
MSHQRPILNLTPRGKLWPQGRICPPGVILSPGGEIIPWGWNTLFAPPFFLIVESAHPWGWTKGWKFTLGDKFHPWGPSSPGGWSYSLGARVEVKNGPQGREASSSCLSAAQRCWIIVFVFSTFCLTDRSGRCLAVNLYNLAPGKGVIIGDTVAIAEPKFSHVKVEHKGQVIDWLIKNIIAFIYF